MIVIKKVDIKFSAHKYLDLDFQHHMLWFFFMFNGLRSDVVAHVVDIRGIHNHYLNYFFHK